MGRKRKKIITLTGSRIFARSGKYYYYSPEKIWNPQSCKLAKWHILCPISEGELQARIKKQLLLSHVSPPKGQGDFCTWLGQWRTIMISSRDKIAPTDPARLKIWNKGTKSLLSQYAVIENAFAEFDLVQIRPVDVGQFLDQWEGRRAAQSYRAHLSKFFEWCCHKRGLLDSNPARQISLESPPKRDVYITNEQYLAIHSALLYGNDGKPTRTGEMVQCYMDLLYLLYQRGTDIRLLRWDQVNGDSILFKPTKTERSSGAKVRVPISADAANIFARLKAIGKLKSVYVIHTEHGQPYTSNGIGSLFKRACARAGVTGITLKDIRAKAATDAKAMGYSEVQVQAALAHTDGSTTRGYIRTRETPVSEVVLKLPK